MYWFMIVDIQYSYYDICILWTIIPKNSTQSMLQKIFRSTELRCKFDEAPDYLLQFAKKKGQFATFCPTIYLYLFCYSYFLETIFQKCVKVSYFQYLFVHCAQNHNRDCSLQIQEWYAVSVASKCKEDVKILKYTELSDPKMVIKVQF